MVITNVMQKELTPNEFKNKIAEIVENLKIQEERKKYIANNKLCGQDRIKIRILNVINGIYVYITKPLMSVYSNTLKVYIKEENPYITFMNVRGKEIQLTGINNVDFFRQFEAYVFRPADYNFAYDLSGEYIHATDERFHIFEETGTWIITFDGDRIGSMNPKTHQEAADALGNVFKCFT